MKTRLAATFAVVVLSGCTPSVPKPAAQGGPNVVMIVGRDHGFSAPDTIPAGLTTIRLVSEGTNLHHAQLIRLLEGKTLADLMGALKAPGPLPRWAVEAGGPNPPAPGDTASATLMIEPGNYALICFVDTPDKVPHFAKGMVQSLVAVASPSAPAAPPPHDLVLTTTDYAFTFSVPPSAGTRTIRIDNAASQPHEVFVVQFAPGESMEDLMAWAQTYEGTPPGRPLGGTAGIAPGAHTFVTLTLAPGEYGLLCFIPDARDGKPHIVHGMASTFRVS